jgi:predicted nucleotidyltransferase
MKKTLICQYTAGSQSYGLATPQSDVDLRGVYVLHDVSLILDPYKYTNSKEKCDGVINDEFDQMNHELRHFLKIVRACNTNGVEMLFNEKWDKLTSEFQMIIDRRKDLIDPNKFHTSLKGYIQGELRLATGQRTGKLGGKRFAQVLKLGFSPKNFVQLLRLCHAGTEFFSTGQFPVDLTDSGFVRPLLMEIKCHPERFKKEELCEMVEAAEAKLDKAYLDNMTKINSIYSCKPSAYDNILLNAYLPVLQALSSTKKQEGLWARIKQMCQ